ncbi:NYN domain-containing protein [Actinomadura formosensis]|uniref:NYN domain-containing protein n=1 Tax=Actinomadura formosensis TaxID=60706 RepID=UPI000A013B85|nr:NYN domain-containing protein [Actinomadura formosensis]
MTERVALFLDYQNVHLVGHGLFENYGVPPYRCVPDPCRVADIIQQRRARTSNVAAVRVYLGRPDPNHQPLPTSANDAQAAQWSRDPRVHVVRRQLNYRGWPDDPPREKGIDVAIAVDLMHLALRRQYDALVLFSGDTDLLPAIEVIKQLRLCHVEVACWAGHKPLRLPNSQLPYCHFLNRSDWNAVVEDWSKLPS